MVSLEQVVSVVWKCTSHTFFNDPLGRHCCLWCHIISEDLKLTPSLRGPVQPRSDATLKADLTRFTAGGSNIKRAKFYNNVIREPLFNISLAQACNHY